MRSSASPGAVPTCEDLLILAGQQPVEDFVRFVKGRAAKGNFADEQNLLRIWQEGHSRIEELEKFEPTSARVTTLAPLPDSLRGVGAEELQDPLVKRCFGYLPHEWAYIDLDRLAVWQRHVSCTFVSGLVERMPRPLNDAYLMSVATGRAEPAPPMQITAHGGNTFSFVSASTDLRVLGVSRLDPANVQGYLPHGHPAAVIGIYVGYGVNFVTAIYMGDRLMSVNGTHRALAVRRRGVTHMPALVFRVDRRQDLQLVSLPGPRDEVEWVLTTPRPPMLKDYLDSRLAKRIAVPRTATFLRLDLKFEQLKIGAL